MAAITPFAISVPDEVLTDLSERLARTRLPNWIDDIGWDQGIEQATYLTLLDHWRDGFDWRRYEERLNRFEHFLTEIEDQPVHFVHARSSRPDALPLMLVHGWPGSFHEFLDAIPLLTEPADGGQAFHVVAPDVPGFGWSAPTHERGWNSRRTAGAFGRLMDELGYDRYGLQGGDVGAGVTANMADLFPEHAVGLHLNFCLIEAYEGAPTPTDDEQREMARLMQSRQTSMGYVIQQGTKPQTLGIGLQDSPAGLLAWLSEKLQAWSDSGGDLFRAFTPDQVLEWVTLYWVTGCITSSVRMYWESRVAGRDGSPLRRIEVPTGVVDFPGERARSPKAWIEERYNLVHFTKQPRGGHFAAIEQPELFASDVEAFFAGLR
ncbi:MAG: epoxide hydrolase family protein [Acidimicrobiia bacterium]